MMIVMTIQARDLSFLETLDAEEASKVDEKFNYFQANDSPNPDWTNEVRDIQESLAQLYALVVIYDTRSGGQAGTKFADHYLTYPEFS